MENKNKIDKAYDKISKSAVTILFGVVAAIIAYFVFTKWSKVIVIEDIVDISVSALEQIIAFFQKHSIPLNYAMIKNNYIVFQIYWIASFPFGYYFISKITPIGGIISLILKSIASAFIGWIVMPISLIVAIISMIVNIRIVVKN